MSSRISKILTILIILLSSCNDDDSYAGYESYRYELWKNLIDNSYQFDFIGTQTDIGSYPDYSGLNFDTDHEGTVGINSNGILNNLNGVLSNIVKPDVVLLGIGINDLRENAIPSDIIININQIIDILQNSNPNMTIFIEQIAPVRADMFTSDFSSRFNEFNMQIYTLAVTHSDSISKILAVDINANWQQDYFADDVHYSIRGAKEVADRYFNAMEKELSPSNFYNILTLGDSRVKGSRP